MLDLTHLIGFGVGGSDNPSISFIGSASSNTDLSVYTFSAQSLGAAASDRKIIVGIGWSSATAQTLSSVTIGGVTATIIGQIESSGSSSGPSALVIAAVPTGATGDVVVTLSGGVQRLGIGIFRVVGLVSSTAHATATDDTAVSGVVTTTLNVPANGIVVAMAGSVDGASWSWTAGPVEDFDIDLESAAAAISGAHQTYVAAQTPLTVTATCGTGSRSSLFVASWGN